MQAPDTLFPPYEAPTLTVDAVVFQFIANRLHIVLVRRKREPFAGMYALPGVYTPRGETTRESFGRALEIKAGIDAKKLGLIQQLYASDTVARDPRGHAVSIVYLGLGHDLTCVPSSTTEDPLFLPVDELSTLAFDHKEIVANALMRLQAEVMHTNLLFALLPKQFTLTRLQMAYESILGKSLDKRNFRKKILALDLVEATDNYLKGGAHRPAQLYAFKHMGLAEFSQAFV